MISSKIENYRRRANSILKANSVHISDGEEMVPAEAPAWDLESLENESDQLLSKAEIRLKKLKSTFSQMGLFRWIKRWRSIRKAEQISLELDNLYPKLKTTHEEVQLWLDVLKQEKSLTVIQGYKLVSEIQHSIQTYQSKLHHYEDLNNDCLQISFDISQFASELLDILAFDVVSSLIFKRFYYVIYMLVHIPIQVPIFPFITEFKISYTFRKYYICYTLPLKR
jgi:hypothetical protein